MTKKRASQKPGSPEPAAQDNVDTAEIDRRLQQRAAALAQVCDSEGKIKTSAEDWTPVGPYGGSTAMQELSKEFGTLASGIVKDFKGGK